MNIKLLTTLILILVSTQPGMLSMEPPNEIEPKLETLPQELIHIIAGFLINQANRVESATSARSICAFGRTNRRLRSIITSFPSRNNLRAALLRQREVDRMMRVGWRHCVG